jgi:hypothetical protein
VLVLHQRTLPDPPTTQPRLTLVRIARPFERSSLRPRETIGRCYRSYADSLVAAHQAAHTFVRPATHRERVLPALATAEMDYDTKPKDLERLGEKSDKVEVQDCSVWQ